MLKAASLPCNSYHHQAVQALGEHLRVCARSRDGVIEGIEADDGRDVLGVQNHPEISATTHPTFERLFTWLVGRAGAWRQRREARAAAE